MEDEKQLKYHKAVTRRAGICAVFATLCTLALFGVAFIVGCLLTENSGVPETALRVVFWTVTAVYLSLCFLPELWIKKWKAKMNTMRVAEIDETLSENKENARNANQVGDPYAATQALRGALRKGRIHTTVLFFLSVCVIIVSVVEIRHFFLPFLLDLFACCVLFGYFYRLFAADHPYYDWSDAAKETDFPLLYAMASRAMAACGVRGRVHILFGGYDGNACISRINFRKGKKAVYSLKISTSLLDILTEEELYNVLLHEFSHVSTEAFADPNQTRFGDWLAYSDTEPKIFYNRLMDYLLLFYKMQVYYESMMLRVSNSEFVERMTDVQAVKRGNAEQFASALVKINMMGSYQRIDSEYFGADRLLWGGETFPTDLCTYANACFRRAFAEHREKWFAQYRVEKQPRNATHPIVRDRLACFGVSLDSVTYTLPDADAADPFHAECRKAIALMDARFYGWNEKDFAEGRKKWYSDSLEILETFEKNGRTCRPDEYRKILGAYSELHRFPEAIAFCQTVLEDTGIDAFSKTYPLYWLGVYRLDHDDGTGLEMVYRAAEANSNFIEGGIETIGAYCCRNGLEEEYAEYRRRAVIWLQHSRDVTCQRIELNEKDRLSEEQFSEEKKKMLLDFMVSAGKGKLRAIYLVHKTISEEKDGYASQFFLEYTDDAGAEERQTIYNQIFNFLDTLPEDWEYALFDYTPAYGRILQRVGKTCVYLKEETKN